MSGTSGVLLLGGGVGAGVWLVLRVLGARPSLAEVGAALAAPGRPARTSPVPPAEMLGQRLARRLVSLLTTAGLDPARRAGDLRVARRTVEQHVISKLLCGTAGVAFGLGVGLAAGVGAGVTLLVSALAGAGGFLLPELTLTGQARDARTAFRHAFGAYLDLVNVIEAAGTGPETALHTAAEGGDGWAFAEIRAALTSARRTRRSVWDALGELGQELDVAELSEFAASLALVDNQGARIRATLAAKADAMRAQQIADAKAQAEATTERMTVPVVLLLLAFLVFIAYPAVAAIGEVGAR